MTTSVTDGELLDFVRGYVRENDLVDESQIAGIGLDASLEELGFDSIGVAELLLGARAELIAAGRISPDTTLSELPDVSTVGDLAALLRSLEG